jgi:hypothetical protein
MVEEVHTSETSVSFNMTTRRYTPGDYKLHTRCREDLKSHMKMVVFWDFSHLVL